MAVSYGPANYPAMPTTATYAGLFPTSAIPGATDYPGQAIAPENNLYPGAATFAGQGNLPFACCRLSFSDVATSPPVWTNVLNSDFRSFSVSRGRDSDFQEIDAGTATVVLDNRDRAYDPTVNASVRPLNRVWLYEEFSGSARDLFVGYVHSWGLGWPGGGWSDAVVTADCADEFSILALEQLPTTSPPRDSYQNLVLSDNPAGYWSMDQDAEFLPTVQEQPPDYIPPVLQEIDPSRRRRFGKKWS